MNPLYLKTTTFQSHVDWNVWSAMTNHLQSAYGFLAFPRALMQNEDYNGQDLWNNLWMETRLLAICPKVSKYIPCPIEKCTINHSLLHYKCSESFKIFSYPKFGPSILSFTTIVTFCNQVWLQWNQAKMQQISTRIGQQQFSLINLICVETLCIIISKIVIVEI